MNNEFCSHKFINITNIPKLSGVSICERCHMTVPTEQIHKYISIHERVLSEVGFYESTWVGDLSDLRAIIDTTVRILNEKDDLDGK